MNEMTQKKDLFIWQQVLVCRTRESSL